MPGNRQPTSRRGRHFPGLGLSGEDEALVMGAPAKEKFELDILVDPVSET